jgi:hypothetical protein
VTMRTAAEETGGLSASGFADLLPAPPKVSAAFRAFFLQVVEPPPIHLTMAFADHVLSSPISGTSRLRRQVDGRSVDGWSRPGTMILTPAHLNATWDAEGTNRLIFLYIPHAFLSRVIAEEWDVDPGRLEIVPQFLARDPVVEGVLTRLSLEVRVGRHLGSSTPRAHPSSWRVTSSIRIRHCRRRR